MNNKITISFFYAEWCGHCNIFSIKWDKITKYNNVKKKFIFKKINYKDPRAKNVPYFPYITVKYNNKEIVCDDRDNIFKFIYEKFFFKNKIYTENKIHNKF